MDLNQNSRLQFDFKLALKLEYRGLQSIFIVFRDCMLLKNYDANFRGIATTYKAVLDAQNEWDLCHPLTRQTLTKKTNMK